MGNLEGELPPLPTLSKNPSSQSPSKKKKKKGLNFKEKVKNFFKKLKPGKKNEIQEFKREIQMELKRNPSSGSKQN